MLYKFAWLGLCFILLAVFAVAQQAQAADKRIVVLKTMSVPVVEEHAAALVEQFTKQGYGAGIAVLNAEGNKDRADSLLADALREGRPDVIITVATLATQSAKKLTEGTDIPVVFCVVADPVGSGIISKMGEPSGTNITGLVHSLYRDLKVSIAKRLVSGRHPGSFRVGLVHSDYPSSLGDAAKLHDTAQKAGGVAFVNRSFPYEDMPTGYEAMVANAKLAMAEIENGVDYWWLVTGPLSETADYADVFLKHSVKPLLMGNTIGHVQQGALCAVSPDVTATGHRAAELAITILGGTPAGTIPVVVPDVFKFGINLATALRLGIVVPPDLLALAGPNVFR